MGETGPSAPPARGDPANPGRSRVTLKPPSCPTEASRGSSPPSAPQKVCPGRGGGTHVLGRRRRPLVGLGSQLLDALRLGAGGHRGARAGVLAHAGAGPGGGWRLWLRPGRQANFAPRRPRRSGDSVRAAPPPRPPPPAWPPHRRLATRNARPSAAKLLRASGPPASAPAPTPGSEARAPLGRPSPRLPALPARFPRPPLCAGVSSSPRTPRGRCAGGGGAAPGTAVAHPRPWTPPPGPNRLERRGAGGRRAAAAGLAGSGCTSRGRDGAALSLGPSPPASTRVGFDSARGRVQCPLP